MTVAALAVVHEQPAVAAPPGHNPGVAVSLTSTIGGLRDLDITVQLDSTPPNGAFAHWSSETRTILIRPDATLQQALFVLRDLHQLHTTPGHESPSRPARQLRVVS